MVRWLVVHGATIDYVGMGEGSPLMLAAFMGQNDFVRVFVKAGANVNLALPNGGETALHMAAATGKTKDIAIRALWCMTSECRSTTAGSRTTQNSTN